MDLHDGVVNPTAGSARHGTEWCRWCERPFTGDDGQQPELVIWPVEKIDARLSVDVYWLCPSSVSDPRRISCRGSDGAKMRSRRPSVLTPF